MVVTWQRRVVMLLLPNVMVLLTDEVEGLALYPRHVLFVPVKNRPKPVTAPTNVHWDGVLPPPKKVPELDPTKTLLLPEVVPSPA
jgi:hypothetical protein